ncbi:MAG: hypothetical protein GY820_12390 [Gammaproteobacteria bacterium]|nr:hypothetical protein [Gammaproteobacteria bacterium]
MKSRLVFCIAILIASANSYSAEGGTGWRSITSFGCHLDDGTCYFNVNGGVVGSAECESSNIRFYTKTSENGDTWYSMILAAYVADKQVDLNIAGCYGAYPTFSHGKISK